MGFRRLVSRVKAFYKSPSPDQCQWCGVWVLDPEIRYCSDDCADQHMLSTAW